MASPLFEQFPELANFSREDLEDMLDDQAYFQAVLQALPRVKEMNQAQIELGLANESIAKQNLELQEQLYKLRAETQEAFEESKRLEARWRDLEREQREAYQRLTPQFLLMRLRHATTAQDEASEALAASFIQSSSSQTQSQGPGAGDTNSSSNGRDVDEFVREFKEMRKVYHKRVMWGDRWAAGKVVWRDD